jgi:hypothetical protein
MLKTGYQPRTNTVKDEKGDLVTDSPCILARWRNHFSHLFNVHGVSDLRQTNTYGITTSAFLVEMAIEKLRRHNSPGIDQIPVELIKQEVEQFAVRSKNLLFLFGIRRNCLRSERNRSLYLFIRRTIKQIAVIIGPYHFCQIRTKFYRTSCCLG